MSVMFPTNPCQSCGACCAHFRVSFYWSEAEPSLGGAVPPQMTTRLDPHRVCMNGADQKEPCCVALSGTIEQALNCAIYDGRPSPCREFAVDWADGMLIFAPEDLDRCTRPRAHFGLPPLLDQPPQPVPPHMPDVPHRQAG
jgi:hypothetical protein